jgi:hypothetical protein
MRYYGLASFFFVLVLAAAITVACGSPVSHISPNCSSTPTGTNTNGTLQSIALCPATADAKDYPGGQLQFIASGYYSTQPSPVTPLKAQVWGVCQQDNPATTVSVTSSGLARCEAGSSGTYSVYASDFTECDYVGPCGTGCMVSGYAQLTCP